jgi:hypothetical protein
VKLIGNDDVNTRWDYTISCSGSRELPEVPDIAQEVPDIAKELQEAREIAQELQAEPAWKEGLDPCPCTLGDAEKLTTFIYSINGKVLSAEESEKFSSYLSSSRGTPTGVKIEIVRDPIFVKSSRAAFLVERRYLLCFSLSFKSSRLL